MLRPLLRLLVPAALAVLAAAPAHAAPDPTVPLLTGGQITYAGKADTYHEWQWHSFDYSVGVSGTHGERYRNGHIDFDTRWLVEGRYHGVPVVKPRQDRQLSEDYKTDIGSGDARGHQIHYYPDGSSTQSNEDCAWTITLPQGGSLLPADATGRALHMDPVLIRDENETSCSRNNSPDDAFVGYDRPIEQVYRLPDEPARSVREELKVSLDRDRVADPNPGGDPCSVPNAETEVCVYRISGAGTISFECALCVDDIRYEHPVVRGGGWEPVPQSGTFDGNRIRITAKVRNATRKPITAPVVVRDMTHDRALSVEGLPPVITVDPGQTIEVTGEWDSTGFAWELGPHKATLEHDLGFLTPYGGAQKLLRVRPKPVVLVHGWASDGSTWSAYPGFVKGESEHWVTRIVTTMDTDPDGSRSVFDNAQALGNEVRDVRERLNADHVDIVAHSMGGLISRAYIHQTVGAAHDGRPWVSHLVMIGTPNMGSPCANLVYLVTSGRPTLELMPGYVEGTFNRTAVNRKGVAFSILAGTAAKATCGVPGDGDVVVEKPSAFWQIADRTEKWIVHTSMTGSKPIFDEYVTPRIEVGPGGGGGRSARAFRSAGGRPAAARVAAAGSSSATPQVQATRTVSLAARQVKAVDVATEAGALSVVALAPAGVTTELLDPQGKVVASVAAGSELAREPLRTLSATARRAGRYRLRLTAGQAAAKVPLVVAIGRSAFKLTAAARQPSAGAKVTVTAKLAGAGRGARVTARVRGASGRPVVLKLRRASGGVWRATTRKGVAGTAAGVVVTARGGGRTRMAAVAAGR